MAELAWLFNMNSVSVAQHQEGGRPLRHARRRVGRRVHAGVGRDGSGSCSWRALRGARLRGAHHQLAHSDLVEHRADPIGIAIGLVRPHGHEPARGAVRMSSLTDSAAIAG